MREEFKVNGQYVNTPDKGIVGVPFFDDYVEKASLDYLDRTAQSREPFFMSINMKVHQPNLPHPDYIHKSPSKTKYADSVVELDARIGRIMDKVRAVAGDNTLVLYTTDNGAWQDVYPDAGYPVPGHEGHRPRRRQPCAGDRVAREDQTRHEEITRSSAVST